MNIKEYFFEMILSCVCGILDGQVCFLNLFSFFQISDILFIPVWIETIVSDHFKVFIRTVKDKIVYKVFSYGRSGSVSGNVIDAIINIIVIIVFFFLFSVDIKAVYKFIIESLFKIMKMFELLFRKKTKSLIHPCLSEFFIGNKRKVLHFIFFDIKSFFTSKAVSIVSIINHKITN